MQKRRLGNGTLVSEIGLGCMGMDHAYGKAAPREEMKELLHKAVDLGCNFFDTAVVYGTANEELLGDAFSRMRDQVILATKFGIVGQKLVDGKPENLLDSRPESIRHQVEDSLRRLKTDYIDLYYQHRVDPNVSPEEVAETMAALIQEGKIRGWGLSNAPIEYMKQVHAICPLSAIQNQYSMVFRSPEKIVFDLCAEMKIAFVAYSPLGNGFLSGKTTQAGFEKEDFRKNMGRFKPEVVARNRPVLDLIEQMAREKNATPAQIVLAWELAQRPFIIPIPGTTKLHRLEENLGASNLRLTEAEHLAINEALAKMEIDETYF